LSLEETCPHAVQVEMHCDSGSACFALASHSPQSIVVCFGSTSRIPGRASAPSPPVPLRWHWPRHRRLTQEPWPEVLDGNLVMVTHKLFGPLEAGVLPLPGDLLMLLRGSLLRFAVAPRLLRPPRALAPGHHPL